MSQRLIFTNTVGSVLDALIAELGNPTVYVLVDDNTAEFVLPILKAEASSMSAATTIVVNHGDVNKNVSSLQCVWDALSCGGANRRSVLVNVGGGMVTDLGGFAAATFKRGIRFINIPTTLLAAVDASVGGKTGINFNGLKNEVGVFSEAYATIISTTYFKTQQGDELLSGYAEMLKHALLENRRMLVHLLNSSVDDIDLSLVEQSVATKRRIVEEDFHEKAIRKALNLGHTAGHAFESFAMQRNAPVSHGCAVAHGCVVALVLSHMILNFPTTDLHSFSAYVRENYVPLVFTCDEYPKLLEFMSHDKKNTSDKYINFTLLSDIGEVRIDSAVSYDDVRNALDIYRDLMRI